MKLFEMNMKMGRISEGISLDADFDERYTVIKNHIDPNSASEGTMFETYGEEESYVKQVAQQKPNNVWTIVEGDDGMWIINGFHFVNRFGYYITEEPGSSEEEYEF